MESWSVLLVFSCTVVCGIGDVRYQINRIDEDAHLTSPEFIVKYGYPVEIHHVTSQDGYVLELHRIPGSARSPRAVGKPVVFLQHGTFSSSFYWLILGKDKALAFLLANAGYDVWMGNSRGNTYSRKHVTISPTDEAFWRYTWHERGIYDLPAMIDYTLEVAHQPNLYYIGYSKGTTMFFVMASERPEYNAKIKLAVCMAPSAFKAHLSNPRDVISALNNAPIKAAWSLIGVHEYAPSVPLLAVLSLSQCRKVHTVPYLCERVFFKVAGYSSKRFNETLMAGFIEHISNGTSQMEIQHSRQLYQSKRFCQYDYGRAENLKRYGMATPPDYNLARISSPVSLMIGDGDQMSLLQDVMTLIPKLPNLVEEYHISVPDFDHTDFIFAVDAKPLVYDHILDLLPKY